MKKFLGIVLSVCMLLSMTACGDKAVNSEGNDSSETKVSATEKVDMASDVEEKGEVVETTSDDEHEYPYVTKSMGLSAVVEVYKHSEDLSDWGSYDMFMSGDNKEWIYIKYPSLIPTSGESVAYQNDGTVVAVLPADLGSIGDNVTDCESIVDLAVTATDICSVNKEMSRYLGGVAYSVETSIEISKKDFVSLGQFDCCRGEGTLTYTSDRVEGPHSMGFVIYGTFSENGHPFYWAVFDESEDQSLGDIVAQDAERMGYTIASKLK